MWKERAWGQFDAGREMGGWMKREFNGMAMTVVPGILVSMLLVSDW